MFRLLIVDNEPMIVDGLAELFRRQNFAELEIVGAYNSVNAVRYAERSRIDVALLDIRMPGMSGLELQRTIIAKWPRCKVIMLSGYSDFAFVQEAMRHGGVDYLLKTDGDDAIIAAVRKALTAIGKELQQDSLLDRARSQIQRSMPALQTEFFRNLLQGGVSDMKAYFRELDVPLRQEQPVLVFIGKVDEWDETFKPADKSLIGYAVRNIVEELLEESLQIFSVVYDPTILAWFVQPKSDENGELSGDDERWKPVLIFVKETLELIQLTCSNLLNKQVSFFVAGKPVMWSEAAGTFERLKRLMSFHFDMRETILIDEGQSQHEVTDNAFNPDLTLQLKKMDQLEMMLENGRRGEFVHTIEGLRQLFLPIDEISYKMEIFFSLSSIFVSYLNRWGLYKRFEAEVSALLRVQADQVTWDELMDLFGNLAEMIFEQKKLGIQDHQSSLIERIHWYVEAHLANDISLTSIAEFTGHSPTYLSRLYKQMTRTSLSGFIMETRLDKAKRLLEKNQLKISSISEAVGFTSEPSFYRFFKKATGKTPQAYRDETARG